MEIYKFFCFCFVISYIKYFCEPRPFSTSNYTLKIFELQEEQVCEYLCGNNTYLADFCLCRIIHPCAVKSCLSGTHCETTKQIVPPRTICCPDTALPIRMSCQYKIYRSVGMVNTIIYKIDFKKYVCVPIFMRIMTYQTVSGFRSPSECERCLDAKLCGHHSMRHTRRSYPNRTFLFQTSNWSNMTRVTDSSVVQSIISMS